ncbi:MAG: acetyl-CoA acetyltransferase [Alphaproteobacteria bacterium]|jgi:acetyl-CoA C-acetyltransferase|nr:acetyl-CoA acetyltransferase [Alphaproteobacteria bacterium]
MTAPSKNQHLLDQDIVIVSAKRTPMGSFQGALSPLKAPQLGSMAVKGALQAASLSGSEVNEVILGCVLSAGLGQAPARQATIGAGIYPSASCTTLNKVCGSGMKAVMLAYDQIRLNNASIIIAGGMESMTNAPYLLEQARSGYRLGHGRMVDHLLLDGLEDPYHSGRLMGAFAEDTASHFHFTRQDQDAYAVESLQRVQAAVKAGFFDSEIIPVDIEEGKNRISLHQDETPLKVKLEKISFLKPAFHPQGTVTAANSSSLADGAAALVLMTAQEAHQRGLTPMAVIRGHSSHAQEPQWFTTAPVGAIDKLLQRLNWSLDDVDLFEINEAFAVVPMAVLKKMNVPHEKVNIWGGATTLGHPLGASGARILVTLLHALNQRGLSKGIAAVCIGGGEATAIGIERVLP